MSGTYYLLYSGLYIYIYIYYMFFRILDQCTKPTQYMYGSVRSVCVKC